MGMFDFVREAGGKLGSKIYDLTHDDEDITKPTTIKPERLNALRAKTIEREIEASGILVEHLGVQVDQSKAVLTGQTNQQADYEKLALIAGNQQGIEKVDNQVVIKAAVEDIPESTFYTVKSGDTLSKIAKSYYGDPGKYQKIFEANQPMLTDPDKIYVGQSLRIPAAETV